MREQYEILAKENNELKKHGHTPIPLSDKHVHVDRQLKEMESINELVAGCEMATQQLSARKEEIKQKQARIDQLETDLAQVKLELEQFQGKYDKMVHTKMESQIKVDELVARLKQAREQYEILAEENRAQKHTAPISLGDKPVDRQLKEMESINKELVAGCEMATQQLSARKEEIKQKQARIDQLETELAQVKLELEQFQGKYDKMVHTKMESQIKVDELVARLKQAREQYEILAEENRAQKHTAPISLGDKPVDRQLKEMESINKELVAGCEMATQQLSARKEEIKQKQARIDQLETELAQVKLELEQFQGKYDKMVHTKMESQIKVDELVAQAREQYEIFAEENRAQKHTAPISLGDKPVDRQLKDMELINKELIAGCEMVTWQLSAQKEEIK